MAMDNEKYNGWHNYATWRVNLELLDDYLQSNREEMLELSVEELADHLKTVTEEYIDVCDVCCSNLLIQGWAEAFISDVDYYEIAENFKADNESLS